MSNNFPTLLLALEEQDGTFRVSDFEFNSPEELVSWWENDPLANAFEWVLFDPRDDFPFDLGDFVDAIRFDAPEEVDEDEDDEVPDEWDIDFEEEITDWKDIYGTERWNRYRDCWCGEQVFTRNQKVKVMAEAGRCSTHGQIIYRYLDQPVRPDLHGIHLYIEREKEMGILNNWEGYRPR